MTLTANGAAGLSNLQIYTILKHPPFSFYHFFSLSNLQIYTILKPADYFDDIIIGLSNLQIYTILKLYWHRHGHF